MTKEEFTAQLERGAQLMAGMPVTSAMLRHLLDSLRGGDPPWWKQTLKAWERRKFVAWTEAWGLFLTAVHFESLSDEHNPLVPFFPSCGGTAEADPCPALAQFLSDPPRSFFENLQHRHRRSYVSSRASLWMSPGALFFQRERMLPYYLVQINAGAGLDLVGDLTHPLKVFDSELILARIGLDPDPLLLEDIVQRRWLTASALPDSLEAIEELDQASDLLLQRQSQEAVFVQLAPCPADQAAAFIARNIPAEDADAGLLVFNMGTTSRMTDAEYEKFTAGMSEMLKPWGDRGAWLEVESVRGELYSSTYQCRVHRLVGGVLRRHLMASIDFNAAKADYDVKATGDFLEVSKTA